MAFSSFAEFLAMGKHGAFVWSAYAIVVIAIVAMQVLVRQRQRRLRQTLENLKKSSS
ncbi:MAG: heme exporter protein CcmD [Cardiobacteriaceae bacterium]|nr:heme exporter protein CcmD [Cardiobacteriaceae bacterium]